MITTAGASLWAITRTQLRAVRGHAFFYISGADGTKARSVVPQWLSKTFRYYFAGWIRGSIRYSSNFLKLNTCDVRCCGRFRLNPKCNLAKKYIARGRTSIPNNWLENAVKQGPCLDSQLLHRSRLSSCSRRSRSRLPHCGMRTSSPFAGPRD